MATMKLPKRPQPEALLESKSVAVNTTPTPLPAKLNRTDEVEAPQVVKNASNTGDSSKLMKLPKGNEADMQKVRDYQTKLKNAGYNIAVDGVWGDDTKAASRDYYQKTQAKKKVSTNTDRSKSSMKKGDMEFKSVKSSSTPSVSNINDPFQGARNSDDYYDMYKGKEIVGKDGTKGKLNIEGNGEVYYPNGRKKLPNGTMANANLLPRRGEKPAKIMTLKKSSTPAEQEQFKKKVLQRETKRFGATNTQVGTMINNKGSKDETPENNKFLKFEKDRLVKDKVKKVLNSPKLKNLII